MKGDINIIGMERFELWLQQNRHLLRVEVQDLFADSLKCCKMNIDRAAYLLAYQGMMLTLRDAILTGSRPNGIAEGEWNNYLAGLRNDLEWDGNTYDRVRQQPNPGAGRPAVLCMPQEVRDEFPHWRMIRNTCAHYKRVPMMKAHTITLYAFISHYLLGITVEGSMRLLLNEFDEYYDPSRTRPDADIAPLIAKVQTMVREDELDSFIPAVRALVARYNHFSNRFLKFLHSARLSGNNAFADAAVRYIKSDMEQECRYIDEFPEEVHILLNADVEIRQYWHDFLKYSRNKQNVLAEMVAAAEIAEQDLQDAYGILFDYMYDHNESNCEVSDEHLRVLRDRGYFRYFAEHFYTVNLTTRGDKVRELCYKTDFYLSHLYKMEIDDDFVRRSVEIFDAGAYPYTLRDRFRDEFLADRGRHDAFDAVLHRLGLTMPEGLQ